MPFGAIFDLYFGKNPKLPTDIIVHYRNFPKDQLLIFEGIASVREQYFNSLKEASLIKFEEAQNIMVDMNQSELNKLWTSIIEEKYDTFNFLFKKAWDTRSLRESSRVPLRIFVSNMDHFI